MDRLYIDDNRLILTELSKKVSKILVRPLMPPSLVKRAGWYPPLYEVPFDLIVCMEF